MTMALRDKAVALLLLPWTILKQMGQMAGGIWTYATEDFDLDAFVPEWIQRITIDALPKAVAGDDPEDQIEGALILIGWSIATSLFSGFITVGFVFFWGIFLVIGIARYSDWGSAAWNRATSPSLPGRGSDGSYRTRGRK